MKKYFRRLTTWHIFFILAVLILVTWQGFRYYAAYYRPNVKVEGTAAYLYIPTGASMEQVMDSLRKLKVLEHESRFILLAEHKKYEEHVHGGRYKLTDGMTNSELLSKLSRGLQEPVRLTISGNIRTNERLASLLSRYVEADSVSVLSALNDTAISSSYGFTPATIMGMFIPNTYEVYWTSTPSALMQRMKKEYELFWNTSRKEKAAAMNMTPLQVSSLAAIVYEESLKNDEMPRIAGVYVNRLKKRIPLQADPTLKYAVGDFTLRRVLDKHKTVESPYNTYKYAGLPPGPICVPPPVALDAVLNFERHDFLYFCARPDFSGYHNFAKTLSRHNQYAREYQQTLNKNRIYK